MKGRDAHDPGDHAHHASDREVADLGRFLNSQRNGNSH